LLQLRLSRREIAQTFFPLRLQAARDQSILGFDGTILALGSFGFVAGTFHRQSPLTQSCVLIRLELLDGALRGFHCGRRQSFQKCICDSLVDLYAADVETVHATSLDQILSGAMIARSRVSAPIMRVQPTAAMATGSQALQQGRAFSHRPSSGVVGLGMNVAIDAGLIGLKRRPIDVPRMMFGEEHGPLGHG
jgi:hypothetical protein